MNKKEYIQQLAIFLIRTKTDINVKDLAGLLNWNGFRTDGDKKFTGGRGSYKLISATYDWLVKNGNKADADKVALAYKKPDGSYAYEK